MFVQVIYLCGHRNPFLSNISRTMAEYVAGIPPARIVQCHGGFRTAACTECCEPCSSEWYRDEIEAGRVPRCPHVDGEEGAPCGGLCKADITFFGEQLPTEFKKRRKQARSREVFAAVHMSCQRFTSRSQYLR